MLANNPRLSSILAQLPTPHRVLELGCGSDPVMVAQDALHVAIDYDGRALRTAQSSIPGNRLLVQADITHLPLHARFDLILARHPDVDRQRDSWQLALTHAGDYLNPGGVLLVTLYSPPEVELVRSWTIALRQFSLDESRFSPPELVGADRFVLCWAE